MREQFRTKALLLAATALTIGFSAPAWGQVTGGTEDEKMSGGDIIVTARRTEERLQDVPISITVLNQEAIAKRNVYNASDLGAYVPSLSTNANFGPEKSSFAIRGFIQEGRTSPSVGVYFADVVAPRANTGTTSGNGAGVGAFFDLQNVQVLKGPQGTLFGRNTTGGAILLIPAKPTARLEGSLEGSLGNYDLRRLQGVLNVPLSDSFRVRLAADWNKRDGYLRNRSGIGPNRLGDTDYISTRLSIAGDLTPDLENYTIFRYSLSDTNGNISKVVGAGPYPGFPLGPLAQAVAPLGQLQIARAQERGDGFWDVDSSLPNPQSRQETWQVINTTTWKASDTLTVKNIVSYAEFRERVRFSLYGGNLLIPNAGGLRFPLIDVKTGQSGNYAAQSTFTEELQLQGRSADDRLNWQVGAYLEISNPLTFNSAYNEIFLECSDPGNLECINVSGFGTIYSANIKNFFNNKGFYAQGGYDFTEKLSLTGGVRYTIDKMRDTSRNINYVPPGVNPGFFFCQNIMVFNNGSDLQHAVPVLASGLNGPECENTIRIKSNKPTWLIGLDYKPTGDILLYAKWARGYRQGSIISNNVGLETWKPETVDTYEVGAKTSFRGAVSGYFNFAAFYNDFRDQQIAANAVVAAAFQGIIPPSQVIVNAGKSRIWGIEVDASARVFEGLKLDVGYAYLNTKLKSITPPPVPVFFDELVPVAEVGGSLAQSPKNRVTVTATYTLPVDERIGKISLGGTFTHTDANKVVEQRFAPTQYKVKAIDQLNLNVDWESIMETTFDLSFFMTNVTNQKRVIYPISTYPTSGLESAYLNQPRMWGVRLKYHFGS